MALITTVQSLNESHDSPIWDADAWQMIMMHLQSSFFLFALSFNAISELYLAYSSLNVLLFYL